MLYSGKKLEVKALQLRCTGKNLEVNLTQDGSPQLQDLGQYYSSMHIFHSIGCSLCVLK